MQSKIPYAIEAKQVTVTFGKTKALNQFSCQLEAGHIYGLLGRNGAGKSTFLRLVTAQLFTSKGEVLLNGETPYNHPKQLSRICYVSDTPDFGGLSKVKDVLDVERRLHQNWDTELEKRLISLFELDVKRKVKGLSRGMQTAVSLVCGLASQAEITIFDEPSLGLDAVIRERFYDALIDSYSNNPRTIIISTHLIDEVSRVIEKAIMLDHGKLILQENVDDLRQHGVDIIGTQEAVEKETEGLRILRKESFMGKTTYSVLLDSLRTFSPAVQVHPITLQRLFVLLTQDEGGVSDV